MGDHNTKTEQYNYRVNQREFSDITKSNMTEIETRSSDSIMITVVNYMNV
jgi:predicted component of type VI protein secretion system